MELTPVTKEAHVVLGEYETWMNTTLQNNYNVILYEAIPYKWDCLIVVFGKEGSGKSTCASQGCKFLQKKFNINHVVFTPEQFLEVIETCNPEDSIMWDEAITGASTTGQANKISFLIVTQMTQIRKKKLKIFFCFPYLHMLNKYFVMRCMAGIYVYAKGFKDRGHGKFFNQRQLAILYALMKEKYRAYPNDAIMRVPKSFNFEFSKTMCLNEALYDEKKDSSRKSFKDAFLNGGEINSANNSICSHPPSYIRFNKRENTWHCKRCGTMFNENPFKPEKESDLKEIRDCDKSVVKSEE
jgi:hypothetical protein